MYKRFFDLPEKKEVHITDPIKRCYIFPMPILENSMYREIKYVLRKSNHSVHVHDDSNFKSLKSDLKNDLVKESIPMYSLPYNDYDISSAFNFFIKIDSIGGVINMMQYFDHVIDDYHFESSNFTLFVDSDIFKFNNFIYQKDLIRHFTNFLKNEEFDVVEPQQISDERWNTRMYLQDNSLDTFPPKGRYEFGAHEIDPTAHFETKMLSELNIHKSKFISNHLIQNFEYF